MRKLWPLIFLGGVLVLITAGYFLRRHLGIELTPEAIRDWVIRMGWKGPVLFTGLVTFRQFLMLPSGVLLPAGGLCFGAAAGTFLGTTGILVSGLMKFGITRRVARERIPERVRGRIEGFEARLDQSAPLVVGLVTAHPMGPMAWVHWGAGLSSIPVALFAVSVLIGAFFRSAVFAYLGSTLLSDNAVEFYLALALVTALIVTPLVHPKVRRVFAQTRRMEAQAR